MCGCGLSDVRSIPPLLKTLAFICRALVRRLTPLFDGCKMMIVCGLVSSVVLVCLWLGWSVVKCIQRPMILAINLGPLHFTLHWTPLPSLDVARGLKHDTKYMSLVIMQYTPIGA